MRRKIYKKIVSIIPVVIVVFLVVSYFVGLQVDKNSQVKNIESEQLAVDDTLKENNLVEAVDSVEKKSVENSVKSSNAVQNNFTQQLSQNEAVDIYERADRLIDVSLKVQDKKYSTQISEGSSGYELMQELQKQGFQFSGVEHSGIGFYVFEINNLKEDKKAKSYWTLYVNGQESNVGISALVLKNNDSVEWKYETRN